MKNQWSIQDNYDVIIIGAGPGGLSAAAAARRQGAQRVAVLERDDAPGGILNQCVHDGFGIVRYGAQLSGPEYAQIETKMALDAGAEILTGHMVTQIRQLDSGPASDGTASGNSASGSPASDGTASDFEVTAVSREGLRQVRTKSVVLAAGCRERTRGMIQVPGTRPAGIFTAGVAQNLINRRNVMVGKRVVILGSGDIGLIMARRLTLEGARVLCVAEIQPQPCGLARNVRQCLFDYDIPLYLNTTVTNIFGRNRLEAVELSNPTRRIDCDTLILSVGLIPENEVAKTVGVALNPANGGAATDAFLQTNVPGIFACGNAREVMDLADFVSEQGEAAGANAAAHAAGQPLREWTRDLHNVARKGMPEEGSVTCTLCPKGCQVRIEPRGGPAGEGESPGDGSVADQWVVTGNSCPRGELFARQELIDPQRILTTTLRIRRKDSSARGGAGEHRDAPARDVLLPVRSDRPVPLAEMQKLARDLREIEVEIPAGGIRRGDVIVRDQGRNHADIIAEKSICTD